MERRIRLLDFLLSLSDELLADDEDFGLEGGFPAPEIQNPVPSRPSTPAPTTFSATRRRSSESDSDSKLQFTVEHAFGDSDFSPAGTFTARLKSWPHGGQTLTKLRFSRKTLTETDKEKFKELLRGDEFYRVRLPSNVLSPPGRNYTMSSIKAEGINIVALNYGCTGACSYPRPLKFPAKWSFTSHTILKYSEQAGRAPVFTEEIIGENGIGEDVILPEKSFWAKYWMYLVPLGFVLMNAMSQAMNMPEEQAGSGGQAAPAGPATKQYSGLFQLIN
ncbi:hypothetical protein V2J09_000761 [Rumex salicifolius]